MKETIQQLSIAVQYILPEVSLLAAVCLQLALGPFLVSDRGEAQPGLRHRMGWLSVIALGVALLLWWNGPTQSPANAPFLLDSLTWYTRGLMLIGALVLTLVNWEQVDDSVAPESSACLLAITAGVTLLSASNDLASLFLSLELISMPTYVFLFLPKRDVVGNEATLKYFLLSVLSSAIVLFGLSWIYGTAGTTNLYAIRSALMSPAQSSVPVLFTLGFVMVVMGLGFRLTAVPFHFYAPDVFQGASTSGAALLSFVPKVAGFIAILRLLPDAVPRTASAELLTQLQPVWWWLAVLTMFVGNLFALVQTDLRRLLAYSSVSHAGYMFVGLAVGRDPRLVADGIDSLLFYLAIYGVMTVGAFAAIIAAGRAGRPIETIDDLAGLSQRRPGLALMLGLFLLSLTGLPPTAGFLAKFQLFVAAWAHGTPETRQLAVLLGINAVIGAWYYLRVLGVIYLRDPVSDQQPLAQPAPVLASAACTLGVLGLFFAPGLLRSLIG